MNQQRLIWNKKTVIQIKYYINALSRIVSNWWYSLTKYLPERLGKLYIWMSNLGCWAKNLEVDEYARLRFTQQFTVSLKQYDFPTIIFFLWGNE